MLLRRSIRWTRDIVQHSNLTTRRRTKRCFSFRQDTLRYINTFASTIDSHIFGAGVDLARDDGKGRRMATTTTKKQEEDIGDRMEGSTLTLLDAEMWPSGIKGGAFDVVRKHIDSKLDANVITTKKERVGEEAHSFDFEAYFRNISPAQRLGSIILHGSRLPSTQDVVHSLLPDVPDGFVCVADTQTKGKGRGGNMWESPPGCLLFTFVSRFPVSSGSLVPFVQYLVSLAAVEAIREIDDACKSLDLNLKWPNDIYANKKDKIGGVLCQSSLFRGQLEIVVGIGLNVSNEKPTTCLNALLRDLESKRQLSRAEVLGRFCKVYDRMQREFLTDGFAPFLDRYYKYWLHGGQIVEARLGTASTSSSIDCADGAGRLQTMTVRGLAKSGALEALDAGGRIHELFPDGNRFDFMKGLVSRKTYPI